MIVANIMPNAAYDDYWGYQDNILPKFQAELGNTVYSIVTTMKHDGNNIIEIEPCEYRLCDGVTICRLKRKKSLIPSLTNLFTRMDGLFEKLCEIKPDFIFFHGLVSTSILDAIKYKKRINSKCIIVQDNHLDYNIGMGVNGLKNYLRMLWLRLLNRYTIRWVDKVYGVTPWRQQYAVDYFGIPKGKTDLLIMGADDHYINFDKKNEIREKIRRKYGISQSEFLIVSGGKLDKNKQIIMLMNACRNVDNIRLLIFGNVQKDIENEYLRLIENSSNIISIGWIPSDEVYNYFFAADLAAFMGQHSVLWEQACASKIPCLFRKWPGMDHVNNGGNSILVDAESEEALRSIIEDLIKSEKYRAMKAVAESSNTDIYLYSNIAKQSLECAKGVYKEN